MDFNRSDVVNAFMATPTAFSCSFDLPQVLIVLQRPNPSWRNYLRVRDASGQGILFKSYSVNSLASYMLLLLRKSEVHVLIHSTSTLQEI